jgi:hypothetical protein
MKVVLLVMGNVWLIIALVAMIGRIHVDYAETTSYSFFKVSDWYSPFIYNGMVALCLLIAIAHFGTMFIFAAEER